MVMQWTVNPPPTARLVRSQYSPPNWRRKKPIRGLTNLQINQYCLRNSVTKFGVPPPMARLVRSQYSPPDLDAPIVYRLGHAPFTGGRGVRFSLGVPDMRG